MSEQYKPWKGTNYEATRILLLSESAYSWRDNGELLHPTDEHPRDSVAWFIEHFGDNRYFTLITRAICRKGDPTHEERIGAWSEYAYSIYVPGSVGEGAGGRRTPEMWSAGAQDFRALTEEIKPLKIVITGLDTWKNMPESDIHLADTIQAYRLKSTGKLMWCLAVPHPANRTLGFQWQEIGERIALFRATSFPETWPFE